MIRPSLLDEAKQAIFNAFVPEERQKLRKALKYWCAEGGCITLKTATHKAYIAAEQLDRIEPEHTTLTV